MSIRNGQKFRDLHPDRRNRVVTVVDDFGDYFGRVQVRSNRGYSTFIDASRLSDPARFSPVKRSR